MKSRQLTKFDKQMLQQTQSVLKKIHNNQEVIFNVTLYLRVKLIITDKGNHYLTAKGKRIMDIQI